MTLIFHIKEDENTINERLDNSLAYTREVLERLSVENLDTPCFSPFDGRTYPSGFYLFRVLGHVAGHLGHAQITRQMLEQRSKE